jgi:RND family efflux transporter MFP subunit
MFTYCLSLTLIVTSLLLSGCNPPGNAQTPDEKPASLTVSVTQPELRNWPNTLSASGALAPWQEAIISAETGGLRITDILVDVGDTVRKGQLLATLSQESLQAEKIKQQATVNQAKASLQQAQADARRAASVGNSGAMSDQELESYRIKAVTAEAELAAAQAALKSIEIELQHTSILAVDDGVITSRSALLGNVVAVGSELFRMTRQNRIEWQAELDAQQLSLVAQGQQANLTLPDGTTTHGTVRRVAPNLNSNTGRALVYVALPYDSPARAGMYASGQIAVSSSDALTVPDTALVLRDGRAYLFSVNNDMSVSRHAVKVGRQRDSRVEILNGLNADTQVVESGGAFLNDGMIVSLSSNEGPQS